MRRPAALLASVLLTALAAAPATAAEPDRLAGGSRFDTAVSIAGRSFPDGADAVYLARADVLSDALAAGALRDGPVLLVPSCGEVPAAVVGEVERLGAGEVVALGGQQAVCDATLERLGEGAETDRLAGEGRIGTAVAVSRRAFPDSATTVYLAGAADSPDAVAGGSLQDGPILLVPSAGEPGAAVREEVARLDPERVVALGGTAAVADDTLAAAAGQRVVGRISGLTRIETAIAIAGVSFPQTSDAVYLARADVFADAVAAGSLTDGPVLLVPSCGRVPSSVLAELERLAPDAVVALGGTAAVCDGLLQQAADGGDGLGELVFTRGSPDRPISTGTIWTMAADGSAAAQLSPDPAPADAQGAPGWSPDGRYVSYVDLLTGAFEVSIVDTVDPTRAARRLLDPQAAFGHVCDGGVGYRWMPDATGLLINCRNESGPSSFGLAGLDGTVRRIPLDPAATPSSYSVAPDGSTVVFVEQRSVADGTGRTTRRADLTADPITVTDLVLPAFNVLHSPDGSEVYYSDDQAPGELVSVRAARPDGSGDRQVAVGAPQERGLLPFFFSPDGGDLFASVLEDVGGPRPRARLDRLDPRTGTREAIARGEAERSVGALRTSPAGDRIALTLSRFDAEGTTTEAVIGVLDLASDTVVELPSDVRRDFGADWRPAS